MFQWILRMVGIQCDKYIKHGFISARIESWHNANNMPITHEWMEVSNGGKGNYDKRRCERQLHEEYQHQKIMENME